MKLKQLAFIALLNCFTFYGQLTISVKGQVLEEKTKEIVDTAVITVVSSSKRIEVDLDGEFVLESWQSPPLDIKVSAPGYADNYYKVTSTFGWINIVMKKEVTGLDQVVISASRSKEKVFTSPVAIEYLSTKNIENTTASSFYDGLENLNEIDVNTASLTYKSVNSRGFAGIGNARFVQLVDGMDSASPGLNFAFGNLVGLNELDVASVEVLPGASSALYGANAFNGIMFMKSKNPFDIEGVSVYGKTGFTSSDNAGVNLFYDAGARVAKKLNDRVALKFTVSYIKATDWLASDERNTNEEGEVIAGNRSAVNYNGVNVYGDEFTVNGISRTGYKESDLVDGNTDSFKTSFSAYFKPFKDNDKAQLIYTSKLGAGNTFYQQASKFALRDFVIHQHKLEFRDEHLTVRGYTTIEDAGNSYDIRFAGINTLKASNEAWFTAYGQALAGGVANVAAGDHQAARNHADAAHRPEAGSEAFRKTFNKVINDSDFRTGAKFVDQSKLYHADVNYNFKDAIEFAELQVGGLARTYVLDSDGTIFTDTKEDNISFYEFGIYTQLQKKMIDDRLKLTTSIRYDKSENFKGNFSPRIALSFAIDEDKQHNIRASYQTGFRNPTAQDQYAGVDLGDLFLVGSAKGNPNQFDKVVERGEASYNFNGTQAYENAYTRASVRTYAQTGNVTDLRVAEVDLAKPEQVQSFEIGYRAKFFEKINFNLNTYYNRYKNFLAVENVVAPLYGQVLENDGIAALNKGDVVAVNVYTNTNLEVSTYGVNVGMLANIYKDYKLGVGYVYAKQNFEQEKDEDFETGFNTPEHKVKVSLENPKVYKNFGFGINARWQSAFYWQSSFIDDTIEERTVVDAQLSYMIRDWGTKIKLGGTNVLGNNYRSAPGAGTIGSQVYASLTHNF